MGIFPHQTVVLRTPSFCPQDSQRRHSGSKARRAAAAGGTSRAASLLEWWFSKPPMQSRPVLLGAEPPRKIEPKVSGSRLAWHRAAFAVLSPGVERPTCRPAITLRAYQYHDSQCAPCFCARHHGPSPLLSHPSALPSPLPCL
jgi:hypothetical protein